MKLFDRKHRSFGAVFGVGLLMLLLVACGNSGTTTTTWLQQMAKVVPK